MQIHDLPYPDPGVPDARSGPRFLRWLGRNQLGGQLKALAWGLLHFVVRRRRCRSASASPSRPSSTAPAHGSPSRAALMALAGVAHRARRHLAAPRRRHQLDHRRRPGAAAARPQDRRAGLRADPAGRRRARSSPSPPATSRRSAGSWRPSPGSPRAAVTIVAGLRRPGRLPAGARRRSSPSGLPVLALAVLPLLPARHPAGRRPAREGGPGHRAGLRHRRRAARAARHRRRGAVPRPLPPRLPGGPPRRRAQRPDVVADRGGPGAAAGPAADRGRLVRRPVWPATGRSPSANWSPSTAR